jgi:ribosome production factor 2|tara:strand:+ start:22938 stop:23930 length:993 start_codon:yes stop_codon:yes gene_type:complete
MEGSDPTMVDPSSTVNMILKKAKTPLGKRSLMKRAPKLVENDGKMCLMLHGGKSSQVLKDLVTDLGVMKKGEVHKLTRKNDGIRPFEGGGETSLEFFAQKADAGAFILGTHQKKRPDCLTVGRFFDYHLFDMAELLVTNYKGINAFGNVGSETVLGSKPCMVFLGDKFETDPALKLTKNILTDVFRGRPATRINLKGVDRVIVCTALEDNVLFRQCAIRYKKSGTRMPKVELDEMGPSFDFTLGRHQEAPSDVKKHAYAKPKGAKKVKNVEQDSLEGKVGRLYVEKQTGLEDMGMMKMKGLKRERRERAEERDDAKKRKAAGLEPEEDDE